MKKEIKKTARTMITVTLLSFSVQLFGQNLVFPEYKNPQNRVEDRVADLLGRMTLEEKIDMVSGFKNDDVDSDTDTNPESDSPATIIRALDFQSKTQRNIRLGIPQFIMTDGPLGPNGKGGSTNYSASINMAATFDDSLIFKMAQSVGAETRNLGYNMLLAPCINIARAPHNGRTFESFGEDPFLMSRMGVAFVKGVQSQRVATCTKHYIANNQEWNRMSVDVKLDERT